MLKEENVLDTAVSAADMEPSENARTVLFKLLDVMKNVCSEYDTELRQLTDCHEKEMGDNLFGKVELFLLTHRKMCR